MNGGGPARQVSYLHRAFLENGHFSRLWYGQLDEHEIDFSNLIHDSEHTKQSSFLKRPISLWNDAWATLELFFELLNEPYEVIHTHTAKAGLCGRIAAWLYQPVATFLGRPKLKVIHTFHGHVFSGYFNPSMEQRVKQIESWLWKRSDHLIALTEKLKSEIVEHLQMPDDKMQVVPLGLPLNSYLSVKPKDVYNQSTQQNFQHWVGWLGRLVPIKNPFRFLDIAAALCHKRVDLGFVIIGDGVLKDQLLEEIQKRELEDRVYLAGWSDELAKCYAGMDLMLNTSDNEGTPVAVLEAMCSGVPVFATDVGGVAEVLKLSSKCQTMPMDSQEAAELILNSLDSLANLEVQERESIAGLFSQQKLYDQLEALYLKF